MKNYLTAIGLFLTVALLPTQAATYTWDGGSTGPGDNNWNTGTNWVGDTAPGVTGQTLIFSGSNRLTPNNTTLTSVSGLTFADDAEAFTLSGNGFTLAGNITNLSGHLQTIENGLILNATRNVDTGSSGIAISGPISGVARVLSKSGLGTLTLSGTNTFNGGLTINNGTVLVDLSGGGSIATQGITFGGGTLEIKGTTSGSSTMTMTNNTYSAAGGANKIILDANDGDGVSLNFTGVMSRSGEATANFDLSSSIGNHVYSGTLGANSYSNPSGTNSVLQYATVTTKVGAGKLTGFAQAVSSGSNYEITRLAPSGTLPATGATSTQDYLSPSGTLALTSSQTINTLTISDAGALNGAYRLSTKGVMMQEGSGTYVISTANFGLGNNPLWINQFSTSGTLVINSDLYGTQTVSTANNSRVVKTGAGTLILNGAADYMQGSPDIQEGVLQLNGSFGVANKVSVRDGATLSGSGSIGGGMYLTGTTPATATRYTDVSVFSGGTLDATNTGNALDITGSLTLDAGSTFQMDLVSSTAVLQVSNVSGAIVTLNGGDLALTLGYAPIDGAHISLIDTLGGTVSGTFATINGVAPGSSFFLNFSGTDYEFEINYASNEVYLNAVPEPGTSVLLLGSGILAFFLSKRQRRRV